MHLSFVFGWLIDLNGMLTGAGLFYAQRFIVCSDVHLLWYFFKSTFFLHTVLLNIIDLKNISDSLIVSW